MNYNIANMATWEVYESKETECPLCTLEEQTEEKLLKILYREMVIDEQFCNKLGNEYWFCREHFQKLYKYHDKYGLALILDRMISAEKNTIKMPLYKHRNILSSFLNDRKAKHNPHGKCFLCYKIEDNNYDNINILLKLWKDNEDFKKLYSSSKGFCFKHFYMIMDSCSSAFENNKEVKVFKNVTMELEEQNVDRIQEELRWFIEKFNYKNTDFPWKNSVDSVPRSILKLIGNFD